MPQATFLFTLKAAFPTASRVGPPIRLLFSAWAGPNGDQAVLVPTLEKRWFGDLALK